MSIKDLLKREAYEKALLSYLESKGYPIHHKQVLVNNISKQGLNKEEVEIMINEWILLGRLIDTNYFKDYPNYKSIYIYFIQHIDTKAIKIGTTIHPYTRYKTLYSRYKGIKLLTIIKGGYNIERKLHRKFKDFKIESNTFNSREWFLPSPELLNYINKLEDDKVYVLNPIYMAKKHISSKRIYH